MDTTDTHALHIVEYEDKVFEVEVEVNFVPELASFPDGVKLDVDSNKSFEFISNEILVKTGKALTLFFEDKKQAKGGDVVGSKGLSLIELIALDRSDKAARDAFFRPT